MKMLAVPVIILLAVSTVAAQDTPSLWHSISGVVVDKIGHPVARATVCLEDVERHTLRMRQTDSKGRFTFGPVNLRKDHEIYAEQGGTTSMKVPIVESGERREIVVKLKLDDASAAKR